jgi:hypothetical protein
MDYLAIIRKADFIDLFKYGKLNVYSAIDFDGNIKAHANDDDLFEKLTKCMNLFEYSFEYMVIHFVSDNGNEYPYPINIEDVRGLYTFDEEAKKEMNVSFDSRIRLHVSPWGEKFKALHNNQLISQSKRGIDNLWAIFDLSETDRKMCESIITDDIVSEVFDELFSYKRPTGEQSIWTYLLRYERHSFYPKNTKGYFCDYIHVACNRLKKIELQEDVAETTGLYSQIINCSKDDFASLSNIAVSSNLSSLTDEEARCKFAIAAPLFLLMKDKFSDGFRIDSKFINYAKKFELECSVAVYLLGLTLGYDKTYDAYYDFVKLPIFELRTKNQEANKLDMQKSNEKEIYSENRNENVAVDLSSEDTINGKDISTTDTNFLTIEQKSPLVQQGQLFVVESVNKKQPIAWLRLKNKNDNDFKPAFNDKEVSTLRSRGYKIAKRFSKEEKSYIISQGYEVS